MGRGESAAGGVVGKPLCRGVWGGGFRFGKGVTPHSAVQNAHFHVGFVHLGQQNAPFDPQLAWIASKQVTCFPTLSLVRYWGGRRRAHMRIDPPSTTQTGLIPAQNFIFCRTASVFWIFSDVPTLQEVNGCGGGVLGLCE